MPASVTACGLPSSAATLERRHTSTATRQISSGTSAATMRPACTAALRTACCSSVSLGMLVGLDHAVVGGGVLLQQLLEALPGLLGLGDQSHDLGLDVGELLAPGGEVADHADQGRRPGRRRRRKRCRRPARASWRRRRPGRSAGARADRWWRRSRVPPAQAVPADAERSPGRRRRAAPAPRGSLLSGSQNRPMMRPVSTSMSTSTAAGRLARPGMVRISPSSGYR